MGVSTMPGLIALEVMLSFAHSRARCRENPRTPAFAVE